MCGFFPGGYSYWEGRYPLTVGEGAAWMIKESPAGGILTVEGLISGLISLDEVTADVQNTGDRTKSNSKIPQKCARNRPRRTDSQAKTLI